MGGNGKHRWKISIYRSSSSSKLEKKDPPSEFICPISGSLMFDPVVVSSGQTFERTSVQVCQDLGFAPPVTADGSKPDFTIAIPNSALKSTILKWCDKSGTQHPTAPDYGSVENAVRAMKGDEVSESIGVSESELLKGVAEKPDVMFSHAATELNHRAAHFYSSSSEESVIANVAAVPPTPLLPFTTRPLCFSSSLLSTSSSSSELASDEFATPNPNSTSEDDEEFVTKLKSPDVYEQEQALIALRKLTRTTEEARVSLCTPRLLTVIRPLLVSRYAAVQTNAVACIVNISLEKVNKVKIVRSGIVPPLIDVMKGGYPESQENAAGAIFSLALEDENKVAIGVLGALQPLLHALRSESERSRHDSALALYHLSLVQGNRVKLVKLGAVSTLLTMVGGELAGRVMLVLCNLAACVEGRSAMLDANAVEILVGMLRRGEVFSESTRENIVAALYSLSHGSLRFKGLAREAGLAEVLRVVEESGSERAREKAGKMLVAMRGRDEAAAAAVEGVLLEGGGVSRYRVGRNSCGVNSTEF